MTDVGRELRLATLREFQRKGEDQDFMIEGLAVLKKWRREAGPDTTLRVSHALLSLTSVVHALRQHMLEFCQRWKKCFPLRAPGSEILFPYPDDDRLIEFARAAVIEELAASRVMATGLDGRNPLGRRKKIPAENWRAFNVDFENSSVSTDDFSIQDVQVTAARALGAGPKERPRVSVAALQSWFTARRKKCSDPALYPGEVEDMRAAEQELGGRIPRDTFRKVRAEIIPAEWRPVGRRRNSFPPEPLKETRGSYTRRNPPK